MTQRQFTTLDTGKRREFPGGFVRDSDDTKINYDLILPRGQPLEDTLLGRWAALMTRGAKKYTPRNWENACTPDALERARESAVRHFFQWWSGDTTEDHMAAVVFNLNMICYLEHKLELLESSDE